MHKVVAAFPVLPGKDPRAIADMLRSRPDEWRESRRRQGVHVERAYEQVTPMGTFVIAYIESDRPFAEVNAAVATSDLAIDKEFAAMIKDVHGVDITVPPPGEPPETIGDWVDENVTERKAGLAFVAPIQPGAEERGRAFADEAYVQRRGDHATSRRALGVTHETVCLNPTPAGSVICVYLEGDDPVDGNRRFAESRSDYDVWFKERCTTVFAPDIDFNQPLPPITEIFDSERLPIAR